MTPLTEPSSDPQPLSGCDTPSQVGRLALRPLSAPPKLSASDSDLPRGTIRHVRTEVQYRLDPPVQLPSGRLVDRVTLTHIPDFAILLTTGDGTVLPQEDRRALWRAIR